MKKLLKSLISITIIITILFSVSCKKKDDSSASSSVTTTSSQDSLGIDSKSSQSTNQSSSQSTYKPIDPDDDAAKEYPKIYSMYAMGEIDGSYNGTDKERGFPLRLERQNNAFETYPVGYGEGTTGGRGANSEDIYECKTGLEVLSSLEQISQKQSQNPAYKSIIVISDKITQQNTTDPLIVLESEFAFQIVVNSINNLSIIGKDEKAIFDGVGLNFKSSNNIIVQNLTIHHPSRILKNEKDCLEFNKCNFVWVDHCELYNDYPQNSGEKDYYDGLLDVKNESTHITISYNYFHDAWKTSLVGSGPEDLCQDRKLTYHHNIFENVNSRIPVIRSGFGHMYNNYYKNVGTGINSRIGSEVFVENNIFESVKNPICSIEDTVGYYNSSGNVFTSCTGQMGNPSTSDFTPSYRYYLDQTADLKTYLSGSVGVNKINVATAIGAPEAVDVYQVDVNLLIDRAIDEIGNISLNNQSLQKLLYISREFLSATSQVRNKVLNVFKLETAIDSYFALYADDLDNKIASIDTQKAFSEWGLMLYNVNKDFNLLNDFVKQMMKKQSQLNSLMDYYNQNFVDVFNQEVNALSTPSSSNLDAINALIELYNSQTPAVKAQLNIGQLESIKDSSTDLLMAENFEKLVDLLPSASNVGISHTPQITNATNAFNALTEAQRNLVNPDKMSRYSTVKQAYDTVLASSRKMDLSGLSAGRLSQVTAAGGINLGVSVDIRNVSVSYGGTNYSKAVFLSGYGNKGSKCLMITLYSQSQIVLVLNSEGGAADFTIADQENTKLSNFTTSDSNITTITISLPAGEYRIYTAQAQGIYTSTQALIYDVTITPEIN